MRQNDGTAGHRQLEFEGGKLCASATAPSNDTYLAHCRAQLSHVAARVSAVRSSLACSCKNYNVQQQHRRTEHAVSCGRGLWPGMCSFGQRASSQTPQHSTGRNLPGCAHGQSFQLCGVDREHILTCQSQHRQRTSKVARDILLP